MDLQADSVQGVVFLEPGSPQDDALKLWEHLFSGQGPDGFQRSSASPTLESSASGERNGHMVTLKAQVGRIDVVLTQQGPAVVSSSGPPRISDVEGAAQKVGEYLKRLLPRLRVVRAAIVLDLSQTVARGAEGAALLTALPNIPLPTNSTDILLQFNVRRPFHSAPQTQMNRLCTWATGQIGFFAGGPGVNVGVPMIMTPYVGLKIDANTVPDANIAAANVGTLIDELVDEATVIRREGITRLVAQ